MESDRAKRRAPGRLGVGLALVACLALGAAVTGLERRVSRLEERGRALEQALQAVQGARALRRERLQRLESQARRQGERGEGTEPAEIGVARALAAMPARLPAQSEARIADAIVREARRHRLDPLLVTALIQVESRFDARAVSPRGAVGLMQLMPGTGRWLAGEPLPSEELFDADLNLRLGCAYLASLVRAFGATDRALLAYNMGPAAARKLLGGARAGPALDGYPRQVLGLRARLARLAPALAPPPADAHRQAARSGGG